MITDEMVDAALREFKCWAGDGYSPSKQQIRAALEAAERAAWRPASECPSDGSFVLAYRPLASKSRDEEIAIKRAIGGNRPCWPSTVPDGQEPFNPTDGACHVTYFRPLPTPPEAA